MEQGHPLVDSTTSGSNNNGVSIFSLIVCCFCCFCLVQLSSTCLWVVDKGTPSYQRKKLRKNTGWLIHTNSFKKCNSIIAKAMGLTLLCFVPSCKWQMPTAACMMVLQKLIFAETHSGSLRLAALCHGLHDYDKPTRNFHF